MQENPYDSPEPSPSPTPLSESEDRDYRMWAMILHFSQLANFVAPMAGIVAPIVIWQIKKGQYPGIDEHGKMVVNWMLSALVYGIISFLLFFFLIGIPMMFILGILAVVFPIIGGIKANQGEFWKYPLTISFL
jgi:uncharacterized Tic20 family protein